jgi:hypothetical protein
LSNVVFSEYDQMQLQGATKFFPGGQLEIWQRHSAQLSGFGMKPLPYAWQILSSSWLQQVQYSGL